MTRYAIHVKFDGEGYSGRTIAVDAECVEEAREKARQWYFTHVVATDVTPAYAEHMERHERGRLAVIA